MPASWKATADAVSASRTVAARTCQEYAAQSYYNATLYAFAGVSPGQAVGYQLEAARMYTFARQLADVEDAGTYQP